MPKKKRSTTAPSQSEKDTAYLVVKAALSAVPVLGGPAVEVFSYLINEPVSKDATNGSSKSPQDLKS